MGELAEGFGAYHLGSFISVHRLDDGFEAVTKIGSVREGVHVGWQLVEANKKPGEHEHRDGRCRKDE